TAGARVSGIDFKSFVPLLYNVSGHVVPQPDQKLVPAPGYRMTLTGTVSQEQPIRSDGTFEFTRVPPGKYNLRPVPDAFSVPMPVVVEDRNLAGIEFPVQTVVSVN